MTKILGLMVPLLLVSQLSAALEPPLDHAKLADQYRRGDFAALETIAEQARTSKARNIHGDWQLVSFYDGMFPVAEESAKTSESVFRKHIGAWAEQFPKSVTWRIVMADAIAELGWDARGGGWATTVRPEGWRDLDKYLSEAWIILQDARKISTADPQLYVGLTHVALGLTHDPAEGKARNFGSLVKNSIRKMQGLPPASGWVRIQNQIFDEAVSHEKYYDPLYMTLDHMLVRWGGAPDDITKFADRAATLTAAEYGDGMYARVAWAAMRRLASGHYSEYFAEIDLDWPRIKAGYEKLLQLYPDSNWITNQFCVMACVYRDRETAKAIFPKIQQPLIETVWHWQEGFYFWKKWMNGEVPDPEYTPLIMALREHDADAVKALLAAGENPSAYVLPGMPLLQFAINENNLPNLKILLDAGAKLDQLNLGGNTLLTNGLFARNLEAFKMLLEAGADPNQANSVGWLPLHQAVKEANFEALELLLKHKADVNKPMPNGWTPLHVAVQFRRPKMVRVLLANGADKTLKLDSGHTPAGLSKRLKFPEITAILVPAAAPESTQSSPPSAAAQSAAP